MSEQEKEWLKKLWIQIIFITLLIAIFVLDKVMWSIKPPLSDIWYVIMLWLAIWIDPIYIIWFFSNKPLPNDTNKQW